MEFVLTLVASDKVLTTAHLAGVTRYLDSQGLPLSHEPRWLRPHWAADLYVPFRPNPQQIRTIREALVTDRIDILVNRTQGRKKRLLLADMDATIIDGETLDELAGSIGLGAETAAITAKTMRGELDFTASLIERVALLKGLPETRLQETLDRMPLMGGAEILIGGMREKGATCVLVSGGFTFFTDAVAKRLGFHHHHGNVLDIQNGALSGKVNGTVLDRAAKLSYLEFYRQELGLQREDVMAIGDGANDLSMLQAAGLGIGFHPKPVLAQSLDNLILYGDLSAALYAQGLAPNQGLSY
jgi:phosphoserine phosphatase